jgi:hypothetical protein
MELFGSDALFSGAGETEELDALDDSTFYSDRGVSRGVGTSQDYAIACPASRRRTKSSVWVKLFAASVTTVCIHGHSESRWIKSIEKACIL